MNSLVLPKMRKQVVTHEYAYYEFGSENGIPVVMIHGNRGSVYSFAEIIPLMDDDYRIIVLDLPGHCIYSEGPKMSEEFSMNNLLASDYCFSVIDEVKLDKYILIGHSLGAMIVMDMCNSDRKDQITAAILIEPFLNMAERPAELFNIAHFPGAEQEIQDKVKDAFDDGPGAEWYKDYDISESIQSFEMPVLELQGEAFPETDKDFDKFIKEHRSNIPSNWKVIRVPKAGHFLHVEQPNLTVEIIDDFIKNEIK